MFDEAPKGPVIIVSGMARHENAEKAMHIKGKLLYQAMILFNCVHFQIGNIS